MYLCNSRQLWPIDSIDEENISIETNLENSAEFGIALISSKKLEHTGEIPRSSSAQVCSGVAKFKAIR